MHRLRLPARPQRPQRAAREHHQRDHGRGGRHQEGTTGGKLIGNAFDGAKLSGSHNDSWVDVKGNKWLIAENIGRNAKQDGFQTHEIVKGWGTGNVFSANTAQVNGPGYGFAFTPVNGNKVSCDNKVTGAAKGFANVKCG
ncbi:hypothetical protein ACFQX7_24980 [Luedemannella flava]